MRVIGLALPLVKPGDDFTWLLIKAAEQAEGFKDGDVLVVSSKVVATAEGRLVELSKVKPSKRAESLAKQSGLPVEFVEVVLQEADEVLDSVEGAILTVKAGLLCANAGADQSNAPPGFVVLMPENSDSSAEKLRRAILERVGAKVGVVIADSSVKPLRLGTVGQAVGVAGLEPVVDCRGQPDLHGRTLRITFRAIADQLATAAQILMGEGSERVPAVVVRDSGMKIVDGPKSSPKVPPEKDLYSKLFRK
jgi:coenzyme F420-0:L-glutamate ligase